MFPALGDGALTVGLDWITHRGPFQPEGSCESSSVTKHCPGWPSACAGGWSVPPACHSGAALRSSRGLLVGCLGEPCENNKAAAAGEGESLSQC